MRINANFFDNGIKDNTIDLIFTDPPYKCFGKKLGGNLIDIHVLIGEFIRILKSTGQMIIFCNFKLLTDFIYEFKSKNIPLQHLIIWDKRPTRSWIAWSYPLRHVEYLLFAGFGKLNFKDGTIKKGVKRSSFGGKLKETKQNENKVSYGVYQEIWNIPVVPGKKRIHPTEKPKEFSKRVKKITEKMNVKKVLDPFFGSGNLLSAFSHEKILGFEINEKYFKQNK